MEEWGYVDECELQNWKGGVVCMTCQHFIYGVDELHLVKSMASSLSDLDDCGLKNASPSYVFNPRYKQWVQMLSCIRFPIRRDELAPSPTPVYPWIQDEDEESEPLF